MADSLSKDDRVMVTGRLRQRSWETPEGDKRSVTEIEADEVGASLKWATAKVERTSQRGNGDRAQGRERQTERGGDFNDQPLLSTYEQHALGRITPGACCISAQEPIRAIELLAVRRWLAAWWSGADGAVGCWPPSWP
jgi:single-stranded DNA-binding protein